MFFAPPLLVHHVQAWHPLHPHHHCHPCSTKHERLQASIHPSQQVYGDLHLVNNTGKQLRIDWPSLGYKTGGSIDPQIKLFIAFHIRYELHTASSSALAVRVQHIQKSVLRRRLARPRKRTWRCQSSQNRTESPGITDTYNTHI